MSRKMPNPGCGLAQEAFAKTYGFALSAVRDWERGASQTRTQRTRPAQDRREGAGSSNAGVGGMSNRRSL